MNYKREDIKNIHYNNQNEIQFEYGGQIHHYSMNYLKGFFVKCWNLIEENMFLKQENQSLKDRIEKAIEYINKIELDNYDIYTANILLDRNDELLEILKGDKEC